MTTKQIQRHALVLGASGISGWSLLNQLCQYPSADTWQRISGTTNRPFDLSEFGLPADKRLHVYSGIDLTKDVDNIGQSLTKMIEDVDTVTHVFFTAYIAKETRAEQKQVNTQMLENSVRALDHIAPNLCAVILQTGGKGYGMEYADRVAIVPPLSEDLPRIPQPWRDEVFYYSQYDVLKQLSQSSKWTFVEIRPDGIIGFLPGNNPMNMARGIALYLSIYRAVFGKGAEVPFPGTEKSYQTKHSDTFQDILSKMEIYVALKDGLRADGPAFNIANEDNPIRWAQIWPGIARHFGLVGVGPRRVSEQQSMEDFVKSNREAWDALCKEFSLQKESIDVHQWRFTHFMLVNYDFDHWYDLSRVREGGFSETIDTVEGYRVTFERMAAARMIPRQYIS